MMFLIFLSHKHEDKEFVGVFAQTLKEMYGEENVFFDDWSIRPGENIIEKMEKGLEECKFFFFFITENSLQSEMVTLEWTTAIKERSKRNIQFIPVRADNVSVPLIISTLKYLDLYNNGMDITLTQMRDIIEDDIKTREYPTFNNLQAFVVQEDKDTLEFYVTTKRFFEPSCKFIVFTDLNQDEATFTYNGSGLVYNNFLPNTANIQGHQLNGFYLGLEGGVQKGFKIKLTFKKKVERGAEIHLGHVKTETRFDLIECIAVQSKENLPIL
jgi:hypothetical protein